MNSISRTMFQRKSKRVTKKATAAEKRSVPRTDGTVMRTEFQKKCGIPDCSQASVKLPRLRLRGQER